MERVIMKPVNRRLMVEPYEEEQDKSSFIIPEEYQEKSHIAYKITATSNDCSLGLDVGDIVVAHSTDPEIIHYEGRQYHLLLENRVVCVAS
jgi:co-chaperonin GroES (HSP10)